MLVQSSDIVVCMWFFTVKECYAWLWVGLRFVIDELHCFFFVYCFIILWYFSQKQTQHMQYLLGMKTSIKHQAKTIFQKGYRNGWHKFPFLLENGSLIVKGCPRIFLYKKKVVLLCNCIKIFVDTHYLWTMF